MIRITSPLYREQTSARLLVGCMTEPAVLEICSDVETDDFATNGHRATFGAIRGLQARGEPIGPVEVHEEMRRLDWEMDKHTSEWVTLETIVELMDRTLPYRAHAPERVGDRYYRNGVEVDWSKFLDLSARLARIVRNTVDDQRITACARLGISDPSNVTSADDLDDEARVDLRRCFVLRDAETLRFYREHPEFCVYPAAQAQAEVPDVDQPLRVEREPHRRRTRRAVG